MEKAVLEVKIRYRKKFSKNAIKLVLKHALFEKRLFISNFRHLRGFLGAGHRNYVSSESAGWVVIYSQFIYSPRPVQ
jgi:hypothetical protein